MILVESVLYFFNLQCIAYYHKQPLNKQGKFIRCEVLDVKEMNNKTCYVLFATDYGFQFHIFGAMNMYKLPVIFKFMPTPIIKVGLDILPGIKSLCYSTFVKTAQYHHEWTTDAIERFRKYFEKSIIVNFEPIMPEIQHNGITFGKMIIVKETTGKALNIADRLVSADMAMQPCDYVEFWKHYQNTTSAHVVYCDDKIDGNAGISELPSFEWYFRKAAKTLKTVREKKINKEWTDVERQNARKVLTWMYRNEQEGHVTTVPSDDDFNEEEDLFDFYVELDEENKKDEEIPPTVLEKRQVLQKSSNPKPNEIAKPLRRAWNPTNTFMPGGFQIATHVANLPHFVNERRDTPAVVVKEEISEACGGLISDNNDLEWPDSD